VSATAATRAGMVDGRPETTQEAVARAVREVPGITHVLLLETWAGNRRPFRCVVYRADGSWVGSTGGCTGESRSLHAGERIVAQDLQRARNNAEQDRERVEDEILARLRSGGHAVATPKPDQIGLRLEHIFAETCSQTIDRYCRTHDYAWSARCNCYAGGGGHSQNSGRCTSTNVIDRSAKHREVAICSGCRRHA